jgi:hypothetical protein
VLLLDIVRIDVRQHTILASGHEYRVPFAEWIIELPVRATEFSSSRAPVSLLPVGELVGLAPFDISSLQQRSL